MSARRGPEGPPAVVLTGLTGSGKSALAARVAARAAAMVVNADARQVYAGVEIGTAAPTAGERAGAPHRLYGHVAPTVPYSLGAWLNDLDAVLKEARHAGQPALLVGGPGLYLAAVVFGYTVPPTDSDLRQRLEAEREARGLAPLAARLLALDPAAGEVVDLRNPRRVIRALEVCLLSGKPFSRIGRARQHVPPPPVFLLEIPAAELAGRLRARCEAMFGNGIVAETAALLAAGIPREAPAFSGIGYPQALAVLEGRLSIADAVAGTVQATRNLVRRQRNWLRRLAPAVVARGPAADIEDVLLRALS